MSSKHELSSDEVWPEVRLGNLISLRGGLSYQGSMISDEGNSMVTMGCISPSSPFKLSGLKRYSGAFGQQHLLKPGDIVIATRDVTQNRELIGCPAIIPDNLPGDAIIAATNLYKVINNSDVENKFLYLVLKSPKYRNEMVASAKGTTVVMLTKDAVENFVFRLPPQSVRREMTEFFSDINDRITLLRETNATLEALAQALFKSWFVDFDPVRAKMEGRMPEGMDEATAALFPDSFEETELGEVPRGWHPTRLDSFIELVYGKALKAEVRRPGTVPVYGSGGLTGWHDEALVNGQSIVVGRKGTVGSLYWASRPFYPIDTVFYVRSTKPLSYCYQLLKTLSLNDMNTDAAVPGLNRENVYRLLVPNPPEPIINIFIETAETLRRSIDHNTQQSDLLVNLRDSLLPRLISGQLSPFDTHAQLEESLK